METEKRHNKRIKELKKLKEIIVRKYKYIYCGDGYDNEIDKNYVNVFFDEVKKEILE